MRLALRKAFERVAAARERGDANFLQPPSHSTCKWPLDASCKLLLRRRWGREKNLGKSGRVVHRAAVGHSLRIQLFVVLSLDVLLAMPYLPAKKAKTDDKTTITVAVGSKNPCKLEAVRLSVASAFSGMGIHLHSFASPKPSGIRFSFSKVGARRKLGCLDAQI